MGRESREIRAAVLGAVIVAVYMALVLASGRVDPGDFGRLLAIYLQGSFSLWLLVAAFALTRLAVVTRAQGEGGFAVFQSVRIWLKARWERDRLVSLFWPPILFATLLASFNAFKQMILPAAGFRFDPLFAAWDRALFLGHDPWTITHAVFGSPIATYVIDKAYHGWFAPMAFGLVVCAWLPAGTYRLRTQYMLSYIFMWIGVGSILAFLLPAAGPCYYGPLIGEPENFRTLMDSLASDQAALGMPLSALAFQADLLSAHGSNVLIGGGGISAMPSVHNGLAALFAFAAFRINRTAGWLTASYAAIIWLGSVHLGWHYAIDGLLAFALAWGIWAVAGRIAEALERKPARRQLVPAAEGSA